MGQRDKSLRRDIDPRSDAGWWDRRVAAGIADFGKSVGNRGGGADVLHRIFCRQDPRPGYDLGFHPYVYSHPGRRDYGRPRRGRDGARGGVDRRDTGRHAGGGDPRDQGRRTGVDQHLAGTVSATPSPRFPRDVAVIGGLWVALSYPWAFVAGLVVFILLLVWLLPKLWRGVKRVFSFLARLFGAKPAPASQPSATDPSSTPPPLPNQSQPPPIPGKE